MKYLLILFVAGAARAASILEDPVPGYTEDERYFYYSGDDEVLHLVDAQEPVNYAIITEECNPTNNVYELITRANPTTPQILQVGNEDSVTNSYYRPNVITAFLVHGWNGNSKDVFSITMRNAFLQNDDYNVIIVDWSKLAGTPYPTAKYSTEIVGREIGEFILWLVELGLLFFENVHIVGFSLGAHGAGFAGRTTGSKIGRITACDPAGPLWHFDPNRIAPKDAVYVEAIQTEGTFYGIGMRVAYADFMPNGGKYMPGCSLHLGCSHKRSYEYMASTVINNHLLANECASMEDAIWDQCTGSLYPMGNSDPGKSRPGLFRVNTGERYPF